MHTIKPGLKLVAAWYKQDKYIFCNQGSMLVAWKTISLDNDTICAVNQSVVDNKIFLETQKK